MVSQPLAGLSALGRICYACLGYIRFFLCFVAALIRISKQEKFVLYMLKIRTYSYCLLICLIICLIWPATGNTLTARDTYYKAQNCYQRLQNNSKDQKYRDNWLRCIDKFKDVYRSDPAGPWAAAGLYMTGQMYQALYNRSYAVSDQKEARDSYERIVKRYPKSRYKPKAVAALKKMGKSAKPAASPSVPSSKNSIKSKYLDAEACYQDLARSANKRRYRENWLKCINKFKDVHRSDPHRSLGGRWSLSDSGGLPRIVCLFQSRS